MKIHLFKPHHPPNHTLSHQLDMCLYVNIFTFNTTFVFERTREIVSALHLLNDEHLRTPYDTYLTRWIDLLLAQKCLAEDENSAQEKYLSPSSSPTHNVDWTLKNFRAWLETQTPICAWRFLNVTTAVLFTTTTYRTILTSISPQTCVDDDFPHSSTTYIQRKQRRDNRNARNVKLGKRREFLYCLKTFACLVFCSWLIEQCAE